MEGMRKTRIACMGNSVTAGYGLEDRETDSYPARLQALCGDRCDVRNYGVNGATLLRKTLMPYCSFRSFDEAILFRPDIVVIELGNNDVLPGRIDRQDGAFVNDYMELIHYIRGEVPSVAVYLTTLTPILWVDGLSGEYLQEWTGRLQELILEVSGLSGAPLIDICGPLREAVRHSPGIIPDGIHPDRDGARVIADAVYSALGGRLP